jgi:ABC-2 type transport system permease protein
MHRRPNYLAVFLTFARNSLVRDMTFRANFLIETVSSLLWMLVNLGFYTLIFQHTPSIGVGTDWGKYQFFLFFATTLIVNSLVHALFMTNADEFSELIRTGSLDFALLKPIDTQFLVSLQRIEWSSLSNLAFGLVLLIYALCRVEYVPGLLQFLLYPAYVACGLASTSVWLGRNHTLYDFWFYITNFARYPMEIYSGRFGTPLRVLLTFIVPVLVAVNVPAQLLVRPLVLTEPGDWVLPVYAVAGAAGSLAASRWVFRRALESYRSASS